MIFITCTLLSISLIVAILCPFFLCEASFETSMFSNEKKDDLTEEERLLQEYNFLEKSFKNGKISKTSFDRQKEFIKDRYVDNFRQNEYHKQRS